jgi:glutathione S-transferase
VRLILYAIPGSHPCQAAEAALALKGLAYERVDLLPGLAQFHQLVRFGRHTVPALRVDEYKVVGTPLLFRALDGIRPDPPLLPRDPAERAAVEEAEHWGDTAVQDAARWILQTALIRRPDVAKSFLAGANVPNLPDRVTAAATRLTFRAEIATIGPGRAGAQRWMQDLPRLLDHADELVEAGTIGGETPNAADLQIGASMALLMTLEDLRPAIEPRPCGRLAARLFAQYPGSIPRNALPDEWLRASWPHAPGPAVTSAG